MERLDEEVAFILLILVVGAVSRIIMLEFIAVEFALPLSSQTRAVQLSFLLVLPFWRW